MVVAREKQPNKDFIPIEVVIETKEELDVILQALNFGRRGGWPGRDNIFDAINTVAAKQNLQFKG